MLAEKQFPSHFSLVVNAENLLVGRQTRHEQVVCGPLDVPLDGLVANGALKMTR